MRMPFDAAHITVYTTALRTPYTLLLYVCRIYWCIYTTALRMPSVAAHITHITLTAPTAPMLLRYSRPLREALLALLAFLKALTLTNSTYATALLKGVT